MTRLLIGVLTALVVCTGAAPAHADGEIGLSRDGDTWTELLSGPLFDPGERWVPGAVRTSTFYVRNRAPDRANLHIEVRTDDGDRLRRDGALTLEARVGGDRWTALGRTADAHMLSGTSLAPGDEVRVRVRATLDRAATNTAQRADLGLRIRIVLVDARAAANGTPEGETVEDSAAQPDDGLLPGTGAPPFRAVLLLAAILLGAGITVLRCYREVIGRD